MSNTIKRIYIRHYRDNGQTVAYVDWADGSRTEGRPSRSTNYRRAETWHFGEHIHALFQRGKRDGLKLQRETW